MCRENVFCIKNDRSLIAKCSYLWRSHISEYIMGYSDYYRVIARVGW